MATKSHSVWASNYVLWGAVFVAVLVLAGLGGGLGYYFTKGPGASHSSSSNNNGTTKTTPTISPNTNLSIILDSRFSRSFWGIDYTPQNAQLDLGCGSTQDDVVEDLKVLWQLTPRIRIYGLDCQQGDFILNGLKLLNISMGVILTIWVDNNMTTYERQYNTFFDLMKTYGYDQIIAVSVGNEGTYIIYTSNKKKRISIVSLIRKSPKSPKSHFSKPHLSPL